MMDESFQHFCYFQRPSLKDKIKCLTNQGDHKRLEIRRKCDMSGNITEPKTRVNHYKFQTTLETFKNVKKKSTGLISEAIWEMFGCYLQ